MGLGRVAAVVLLAALCVVGCAGRGASTAPPIPTAISAPISKATWTDGVWPFTVPDGVVKCYTEDGMVTFVADGVEYGLNQAAIRFGHYPDIDAVVPTGPRGLRRGRRKATARSD